MMRTLTFAAAFAAAIALPALVEDFNSTAMAAGANNASLTAQEAQAWVGKPVYSSDGKKLGQVAAIRRTDDNKITELRADIGGFLGIGEHQVVLPAPLFSLQNDRVVLNLTASAAKGLPKVVK